jgi:integrase
LVGIEMTDGKIITATEIGHRGLTVDECLALCKAPRKLPMNASKFQIWKHQRDELLIRLIYETFARISELLKVDISDVDIEQHAIQNIQKVKLFFG